MTLSFRNRTDRPSHRTARRTPSAPGTVVNGANAAGYDLARIGEDRFRLELDVPGFAEAELEIETRKSDLVIRGTPADVPAQTVLHRGFAKQPFERRFALAEHIRVEEARLANGRLVIALVREVPAALKPRTITIDNAA